MKIACRTLGCKLNQFETQGMAESLRRAGHEVVPFTAAADVYVVNTCTVTGKTDRECRKVIRRVARSNPRAVILAAGCYAERDPETLASLPRVRMVLGNRDKGLVAEKLAGLGAGLDEVRAAGPREASAGFPLIASFGGRTRPFIKVQDGCGKRCSYCVIWQVRGPHRSEPPERIMDQVKRLAWAGYREVVLTGLHLGSWGMDLARPLSLARLLEELSSLKDGPRIRLSSIEPEEFGPYLMEVVLRNPRVCRHFHVPLQSGSDLVLGRMNRGYRVDDYRKLIYHLNRAMPKSGIGTDIIVGFPGETDEDFERTMRLVEELPFTYLHVFGYSRRPGTAAAHMPDQVPREVKEERGRALRAMGREKAEAFRRNFIGCDLICLVETQRDRGTGLLKGVTDNYLKILFPGPDSLGNTFARVTVDRVEGKEVHGYVKS